MKILVLTSTYSNGAKMQFIVDKLVAYHEEEEYTEVSMLNGETFYVKESAAFITQQLTHADVSPYIVRNEGEK